jgi:hypothetical protein
VRGLTNRLTTTLACISGRFLGWLHRWRDLFGYLPLAFVVLLGAFYLLPAIDPRSGIDGFGALWNTINVIFAAMLCGFVSWLFIDTYQYEPRDSEDRELLDHAAGIDREKESGKRLGSGPQSWPGTVIYIWHGVRWLILFAIIFSRV